MSELAPRQPSSVDLPAQPASASEGRGALDFRTIFELEAAYMARTLRRLGVDPADVEDMAHEAFLAVHQKLGDYDPSRPLRPWLFGFAFRVASHYRRGPRRKERPGANEPIDVADPSVTPDVALERDQRRQMVLDALEHVELSRRAVFVMMELDGIAAPAVAETLGIPVPTVHSRLRLARQDFTKAIVRMRARGVTP
jgi:RNA polymerase sigma-70 factor (ECF subfamily)